MPTPVDRMAKKKTPKKRPFFAYSEDDMKKAIEVVRSGMSKKKAAITFNVPRATLIRKMSASGIEERKMGPPTVLTVGRGRLP